MNSSRYLIVLHCRLLLCLSLLLIAAPTARAASAYGIDVTHSSTSSGVSITARHQNGEYVGGTTWENETDGIGLHKVYYSSTDPSASEDGFSATITQRQVDKYATTYGFGGYTTSVSSGCCDRRLS